jgi:apolipoprotein D and lipocalin family protein
MIPPVLVSALLFCALPQRPPAPPRADTTVDLPQFAGTYYEIARIPNRLQRLCAGEVTATYTVRPDGRLNVVNRCRKENGTIVQVRGVGRRAGDGRLIHVRFAAPWHSLGRRTWEDHAVLAVGPDDSYAVLGNESRTCLWILSRLPRMSQLAYRQALEIARAHGYDVERLIQTPQGG